jgi:hypothetical protein
MWHHIKAIRLDSQGQLRMMFPRGQASTMQHRRISSGSESDNTFSSTFSTSTADIAVIVRSLLRFARFNSLIDERSHQERCQSRISFQTPLNQRLGFLHRNTLIHSVVSDSDRYVIVQLHIFLRPCAVPQQNHLQSEQKSLTVLGFTVLCRNSLSFSESFIQSGVWSPNNAITPAIWTVLS